MLMSRMKQGEKPKRKPKLKKGEIAPFDEELLYNLASEERALLSLHYSAADRLEGFMIREMRRVLAEINLRVIKHTKIPNQDIKTEITGPEYASLQIWKSQDVKDRVLTVTIRIEKVKSGRFHFLTKEKPLALAEQPVLQYIVWYDTDDDPFSGRLEFSTVAEVVKWIWQNRVGIRKCYQELFGDSE